MTARDPSFEAQSKLDKSLSDKILSDIEQAARNQTTPVELSKESRTWLMAYFTAGAALVRSSYLSLPRANQIELWRSEFVRFSPDFRWVEFTLKARPYVETWNRQLAIQVDIAAQQTPYVLTERLKDLLSRDPTCPDDVPEVYAGCRELLDVVEAAKRFCVVRTAGRRYGEHTQTYRGRRAEAFAKLREKVRHVTRPNRKPKYAESSADAKIPSVVEDVSTRAKILCSALGRAHGQGFVWDLQHLEKLDWGLVAPVSTPVLNVTLFANVSKGGNDIPREWPSESKIITEVYQAVEDLNAAMAQAVVAGYVCRLEDKYDPDRRADLFEVSVLKKV